MSRVDQQYEIIMYRDLKNPLCEYFNAKDIKYNYIPDHPTAPIIDQIIHKSNNKKILLIVNSHTLEKLCEQQSIYHNLKDLVNCGRVKLIYFEEVDSLYKLRHIGQKQPYINLNQAENIKVGNVLKDLKFIWWADRIVGEHFKKQFRSAQPYELHHPFINLFTSHHFFHMKKEKQKTNTFFTLMRLAEGAKRIHRNILVEKMQDSQYLANAISHINKPNTGRLIFKDLDSEYGTTHLADFVWKDSLPVISLYEKTHFELVTETLGAMDGDDTFYMTEKILKPIVMNHPFIVLSTKHYLRNLRGLGFQTFGDFIDESYDECDTAAERVEIISKNLDRLDMLASKKFYEDTKEIRDHNQRHLLYLRGKYKFDLWGKWNNFFKNFE